MTAAETPMNMDEHDLIGLGIVKLPKIALHVIVAVTDSWVHFW